MCLSLRKQSKKPYAVTYRWKIVDVRASGDLYAPFMYDKYSPREWNKSKRRGLKPSEAGFHVFARKPKPFDGGEVRLVEVRGFLRSGYWPKNKLDRKWSETWSQFRFVT